MDRALVIEPDLPTLHSPFLSDGSSLSFLGSGAGPGDPIEASPALPVSRTSEMDVRASIWEAAFGLDKVVEDRA